MTPAALAQYFRSFLIKLTLIESQLGQMYLEGQVVVMVERQSNCRQTRHRLL